MSKYYIGQQVVVNEKFGKNGEQPDTQEIGKTATIMDILSPTAYEIATHEGSIYCAMEEELDAKTQQGLDAEGEGDACKVTNNDIYPRKFCRSCGKET